MINKYLEFKNQRMRYVYYLNIGSKRIIVWIKDVTKLYTRQKDLKFWLTKLGKYHD